jgi:formylmethanofuran dehydrogenase subunit C
MDTAVHVALLISVVVVATGVEVTGEAAMMTGMAMAAGAVAVAGGPLQHLSPFMQPPAC